MLKVFSTDRFYRCSSGAVIAHGIRVVDVVVAGNHINLHTCAFELSKVSSKGLMAYLFAVLGKVARDKQDIRFFSFNNVYRGLEDSIAFRNHFAVAGKVCFKGGSFCAKRWRVIMRVRYNRNNGFRECGGLKNCKEIR